ncbi:MAG TPA: CrcB family protein [Propionibacteriaceae bacterium]
MAATVMNDRGLAIVRRTMDRRAAGGGEPTPTRRDALTPASLALVWLGGTAGTAARYLTGRAVPHLLGVPVATLVVNVLGAFALGVLLEGLVRRARPEGDGSSAGSSGATGRRRLRLLLGTGFLGGFTTYSALALDTVLLARSSLPAHALGYAVSTLVLGGLASLAGIALAARRPAGVA